MIPDERQQGYVRRWRSLYDSAIYKDPVLWRLYDWLESHVNWKEAMLFDGTKVLPGQIVTSRDKLAAETGLTVQQVRGGITRLENSQFLTSRTTNKYTVLTLTNWKDLQVDDEAKGPAEGPTEQPAGNQQVTSKQPASNHNQRRESGNHHQGKKKSDDLKRLQTDHEPGQNGKAETPLPLRADDDGKPKSPDAELTIAWRYELHDSGRCLRAIERIRGRGRDQDNVWVFDRR